MDVDFIKLITHRYDVDVRMVLGSNGGELIRINKAYIFRVFNLNLNSYPPIDFDYFSKENHNPNDFFVGCA